MIYLLLSIALACEDQICDRMCQRDGDKRGIVVDGVCGCWNPTYKVQIKVPKGGGSHKDKRPLLQYSVELE